MCYDQVLGPIQPTPKFYQFDNDDNATFHVRVVFKTQLYTEFVLMCLISRLKRKRLSTICGNVLHKLTAYVEYECLTLTSLPGISRPKKRWVNVIIKDDSVLIFHRVRML